MIVAAHQQMRKIITPVIDPNNHSHQNFILAKFLS
jgi:hypothetical protein